MSTADGYLWYRGIRLSHSSSHEEAYYADRLDEQPTDDPRERSLWSWEHRSTGPDKDQYEHRGQR